MKAGTKRQRVMIVVAAVALIAAAAIVVSQRPKPRSNMVWYYDVADGTLFPGAANQVLPIDAPSGADHGVLATVYACGKCGPTTRKILYLESNTAEAKKILETMPDASDPEVDASPYIIKAQEGQLIAAVPAAGEEPRWFSVMHPDAEKLRGSERRLCGRKEELTRCVP